MRSVKWKVLLSALCATGAMGATARADVTVEKGASILAFPKVIADGTRDTVIQIANISNDLVYARCFYVNAQLTNPALPEHPILNPPIWLETDFQIRLTRQQPTHWRVSTGRAVDPFDVCLDDSPTCFGPFASASSATVLAPQVGGIDLSGLGIDPGAIPPVAPGFVGELKCVEVDAAGTPMGGNHLKGEATLKQLRVMFSGGDVSKYNAVGIVGTQLAGATGNTLLLNNPESGAPEGEYDACPAQTILNHFAEGAEDPVIAASGAGRRCDNAPATQCSTDRDCDAGASCVVGGVCTTSGEACVTDENCPDEVCLLAGITTELTIMPCSENFEDQQPGEVTIQFLVYNEFESRFSTSTSVICWKNIRLGDIGNTNVFDRAVLGSDVAQTFMTPADIGDGGFLAVAESFRRTATGDVARAAVNLYTRGDRFLGDAGQDADRIVLPEAQ